MAEPSLRPVAGLAWLLSTCFRHIFPGIGSRRSQLGLLDLPPEIRLMIFHYLLVEPEGIPFNLLSRQPQLTISILRTSKLIYSEAFSVLYGKNTFTNCFSFPHDAIIRLPGAIDTIRNLHVQIDMYATYSSIRKFLHLIHHFGHPSTVRNTLTVDFQLDSVRVRPLKWFIPALGRFTNFQILEVHFYYMFFYLGSSAAVLRVRRYLKTALENLFGAAEDFGPRGKSLRFRPRDYRFQRRNLHDEDSADVLDGLRLEWDGQ